METSSSRLANVFAAWALLTGVMLVFVGLSAIRDAQPVVGLDLLPPTHWSVRLYAAFAADDRDEPEAGYDRPAPAMLDRIADSQIAELVN